MSLVAPSSFTPDDRFTRHERFRRKPSPGGANYSSFSEDVLNTVIRDDIEKLRALFPEIPHPRSRFPRSRFPSPRPLSSCRDWQGRTALHFAVQYDSRECFTFLVKDAQFNVHVRDDAGLTPLHIASEYGRLTRLKDLLSYKADVHCEDKEGRTALHMAKSPSIAHVLMNHGAYMNARDIYGRTPLFYVQHVETAQFLIQNGTDRTVRDHYGQTAADYTSIDAVRRYLQSFSKPKRQPVGRTVTPERRRRPSEESDILKPGEFPLADLLLGVSSRGYSPGRAQHHMHRMIDTSTIASLDSSLDDIRDIPPIVSDVVDQPVEPPKLWSRRRSSSPTKPAMSGTRQDIQRPSPHRLQSRPLSPRHDMMATYNPPSINCFLFTHVGVNLHSNPPVLIALGFLILTAPRITNDAFSPF